MAEESKENIVVSALNAGVKLADCKIIPREEGENTTFLKPDGFQTEKISNDLKNPVRKTGTKLFTSAKSFCSYVNKHKNEDETIIIADEDRAEIKAVINDHGKKIANWKDFESFLLLGFSKQWQAWESHSKQNEYFFTQAEFSDFLEDNRPDFMVGKLEDGDGKEVENVSALELSSIITDLKMTSEEKFESRLDPITGKVNFSYNNEEKGRGNVVIPSSFMIAIPIYRSGGLFQIRIRIRYRLENKTIRFHYIIDQMEERKEKAFNDVCEVIEKGNSGSETREREIFLGTGIEVFQGKL